MNHPASDADDDFGYDRPSKSQMKRDSHALQDLGAALVALSTDRVKRLDLPENLREAVLACQRFTQHGAHRRQLQYIGKLMRNIDPAPIQAQLDVINGNSREEVARQHRIEKLRDDLLADEGLLHDIATRWPGADLQQLRVFRRNAIKEREQQKPPRAYRELFRMLRELDLGKADAEGAHQDDFAEGEDD